MFTVYLVLWATGPAPAGRAPLKRLREWFFVSNAVLVGRRRERFPKSTKTDTTAAGHVRRTCHVGHGSGELAAEQDKPRVRQFGVWRGHLCESTNQQARRMNNDSRLPRPQALHYFPVVVTATELDVASRLHRFQVAVLAAAPGVTFTAYTAYENPVEVYGKQPNVHTGPGPGTDRFPQASHSRQTQQWSWEASMPWRQRWWRGG